MTIEGGGRGGRPGEGGKMGQILREAEMKEGTCSVGLGCPYPEALENTWRVFVTHNWMINCFHYAWM